MKIEGGERKPIPHRRLQAVNPEDGEVAVSNPNSAVVWHFSEFDRNGDGEIAFEEEMHRSCGTVAIKNDLLFIADFSGMFHCLNAKTGQVHWSHDMLAAAWGSPLIVEDHVYIGDEDGDISIFNLSADPKVAMKEINGEYYPINAQEEDSDDALAGDVTRMGNSVYSTPIVANNVLFIANRTHLFAITNTSQE
jgi:outer membrane protein assembly factor BamB